MIHVPIPVPLAVQLLHLLGTLDTTLYSALNRGRVVHAS